MKYLFVFGNTPELSKAELEAVLKSKNIQFSILSTFNKVLILDSEKEFTNDFFEILGGTVKVGLVAADIDFSNFKKMDFGVSIYTSGVSWKDVIELDKKIKKEIGGRFVLPAKGETELSSVVVKKQKLVEFLIFNDTYAQTIWVQDFEDWGKRDYGRPEVEAHVGMLPPKVARQMVNLGCQTSNIGHRTSEIRIWDPFCGVGTILMEAAMVGKQIIGSDISIQQCERSKKNIDWLGKKTDIIVCDARKISALNRKVDAIVTEPYLGPDDQKLLEKLYLDCLTDWKSVASTVVIALPSFRENYGSVKNVIDKAKSIGYILVAGPYEYARPQAIVKRNICVFKYGSY